MVFKYCAECGHKVEDIKLGDDDCKICPSCKRIYGRNPLPVVEVDDLKWYKLDDVEPVIARVNNCSGMHFDKCKQFL